jgi:hypothetical protein
MKEAYKQSDGRKIEGRRILVDVERGRTVDGWRPMRLAGGLGGDSRLPKEPRKKLLADAAARGGAGPAAAGGGAGDERHMARYGVGVAAALLARGGAVRRARERACASGGVHAQGRAGCGAARGGRRRAGAAVRCICWCARLGRADGRGGGRRVRRMALVSGAVTVVHLGLCGAQVCCRSVCIASDELPASLMAWGRGRVWRCSRPWGWGAHTASLCHRRSRANLCMQQPTATHGSTGERGAHSGRGRAQPVAVGGWVGVCCGGCSAGRPAALTVVATHKHVGVALAPSRVVGVARG